MSLTSGDQIGPYEILGPLGKGGMGEVFRARDTRLDRDVALKLLAEGAAQDSDHLARFERETRAVAALNHPNILAIHDTGTHRGIPWAVTELLEGETLAERLRSGPIAPKRALEIACQIADGLAAAHARGVIHRDIKPDNIFLTHDGRAKILDFGIARIERPTSPFGVRAVTRTGSTSAQFVVGTAGYMSPEQVRGKSIDPRTDVFSLGAVFYEMLTAKQAFARDSAVETFGAVLKDDPSRSPEAEKIPAEVRRFVYRCLEKDPADRYQSARDLMMDLRAFQAEGIQESAKRVQFRSEPPWKHRKTRIALRAAGGTVLFLLGFAAGSCWQSAKRTRARGASSAGAFVQTPVEDLQVARRFARDVRGIAAQEAFQRLLPVARARLEAVALAGAGEDAGHHEEGVPRAAGFGRARPLAEADEPVPQVLLHGDRIALGKPVARDHRLVDEAARLAKEDLRVRRDSMTLGDQRTGAVRRTHFMSRG